MTAFVVKLLVECVVAFVATWAFAALFNVPSKQYLFCGLTGAAGWACYLAVMQVSASAPLASVAASVMLAVMARIFAARRCCPATVFLISGIFPLVPGAGIYYAAYYFIMGNAELSAENASLTLKIAVAIAIGIVIVLALPAGMFRAFMPKAMRNAQQTPAKEMRVTDVSGEVPESLD